MRRLTVNAFVSLDGVMQALGAPEEDPSGGFTHGGWSVNYWDDEMMELMAGAAPYELLLGRGTYEIFAAHWPYVTGPIADRLNGTRKHVAQLKRQDGPEIQVQGSPGLIQTLLEHDLIDEFRIWTFPLVIGTGKRLFGNGTIPAGLELADSRVSGTGVTINSYERAGDIAYSSFALDEPTEAEIERRRRLAEA